MLNKIANWILLSSKHYGEASLTAKGALIGAVPAVMVILGLAHVQLDSSTVTGVIDAFFAIVQAILTLVSVVVTFVGLVRKIYRSIAGKNIAPID